MKKIALIILNITCLISLYSQYDCGTTRNLFQMQQNDPVSYTRYLNLENFIQSYLQSQNALNSKLVDNSGEIIIPVVVHIVHSGEVIGIGRNISDAQVNSQIAVLNEDFNLQNADRVNIPLGFQPVEGNSNISFQLACYDPYGNSTNGITRTQSSESVFNSNGAVKATVSGGIDPWPTDRYLNIWVCALGGSLLGFSQYPFDYVAKPNTDGIVVAFDAFGRGAAFNFKPIYNLGRTATHEIGHWLNLFHLSGDANCGNDQVDDTPPEKTHYYSSCPTFPYQTSCNSSSNGEMFMNTMNSSPHACRLLFTQDQIARMRAVFANGGPRSSFINNYFQINQPAQSVCNSNTFTLNNPMCLPVSWSVSSGAIITNSNNNQVTLYRNSGFNGIVNLTATSGNYIDTKEIIVGSPTPKVSVITQNSTAAPSTFTFIAKPINDNFIYTWFANNVLVQSGNDYEYDLYLPCKQTKTIKCRLTNTCGTSALNTGITRIGSCTKKSVSRFAIAAHPTIANSITIGVNTYTDDELAKLFFDATALAAEQVQAIRVIDKEGNVAIEISNIGTQVTTVDLSTLSEGVYNAEIYGNNDYREQQTMQLQGIKTEKEIAEDVADNNITILSPDAIKLKEVLQQELYEKLKGNPALADNSAKLQQFLLTKEQGSFGTIEKINDAFFNYDVATAQAIINTWLPTTNLELNCLNYYNNFIKYLNGGTFSSDDVSDLYTLANLCPQKNGEIIYAARSLYNYIDNDTEEFPNACGNNVARNAIKIKENSKHQTSNTVLYPNPAKDRFSISFPSNTKGINTINVLDLHGRSVLMQKTISGTQHITITQPLAKGMYMVQIANSVTGKTQTQKLIIQ